MPSVRFATSEEDFTEVIELHHRLLHVLPLIIVHDSPWMASAARRCALELWRANVRVSRRNN